MSSRVAATRYARALLDVATAEGREEQVERDLVAVADLLGSHAELKRVLTHPSVPVSGKRGVVQEVAGRLELSGPVTKLLKMLADRDRLGLLPDLVEVFRERLMDHQRIIRAEVTTAEPMPHDRVKQLQERLAQAIGRRVSMTTRVDPDIIGGLVTKIGGTVYDGSVARQLAAIRERLAGEA